jgi:predicted alpha/beta-hydrolase family hydrolase
MHWLEDADHGFHVLKSSGRTDEQVLNEAGDAVRRWLNRLERFQLPGTQGQKV